MNKSEFVAELAKKWLWDKKQAEMALDGVTDIIKDTLAKGNDITLVGFGTFTVAEKAERQGRNPKTGEAITIPAAKVPKFKPGKALKDALNG
ncbi:HU family DNA-binding protein [Neisseria musculi]|uniref:Bacterial DNA-binding family protein n=1 Tax=Neisseria musculi TaxID=1815583 RepID=A0A7H1MCU7_9NEIS|nr:HU family DNA-binding protein [Neisseria musculi]QNT59462.1 bacterial DNA-binding family protein [Neisseria musculi]